MKKENREQPSRNSGTFDFGDAPDPTPPQEETTEQKATVVSVIVSNSIVDKDGVAYYPAFTVQEPLTCYLVPTSEFVPDKRKPVDLINPDDKYTKAYDWAAELAQMVPDVETVRRNILVSFWRAGAFDRAEATKNSVRSNMFQWAFPYHLEETQ